jgi:hypothetical protein
MAFALVGALLMLGFQLAAASNLAFFDLPGHVQSLHALGIVFLTAAAWMLCLPLFSSSRWRSWHALAPDDLAARTERVHRAALLAMLAGVHLGAHSAIRLITGDGPLSAIVVLASLYGSVKWMNRTAPEAVTSPTAPEDAADHGYPWEHAAPSH